MDNHRKLFLKFLLLWSGELISVIGSGLTSFGLAIYVFQQTGKASSLALITLFAFVPGLLLSPVAGVLADRYDRRLMMVLGDSLSAIGLVYILLCMYAGQAKVWQICLGVTISSVFSSLLEPSYRATITDLLTEKQYTKASGLVQAASSAKFLISPIVAGFLLTISDVKLLLIIDICTFIVTVSIALLVRKGIKTMKVHKEISFKKELVEGWYAVWTNKGVFSLLIITSILTFFIGFIQLLSTPMILAFSDSTKLGIVETIVASGMLATSILIGFITIRKGYIRILSFSLFFAGIFVVFFGLRENIILICIFGFLFFSMLPLANASLDFLMRTNIDNSLQGRAWGIIGILSQLGYVASYILSGLLTDYVFTPLLLEGGRLAGNIGKIIGTGAGRGTGLLIIIAGMLLSVTAITLNYIKPIRELEGKGV